MPSPLPEGDPAPSDGRLPHGVSRGATDRNFGLYVHIPFCAVRCGYCDFNTYTADELDGVSRDSYPESALLEMDIAAAVLAEAGLPERQLSSVFFGGGTPTLLGPDPLLRVLERATALWGVAPGAEVTIEANPDSVSEDDLARLARGGVTRVSVGVQSVVPSVLATLDRTHTPERVPLTVAAVKKAGLAVSVDLIFGSPGETLEQWATTVQAAIELEPDHISAYSLIVEPGTALARRIQKGQLPVPEDDLQAEMYVLADEAFSRAGYSWYEISNWAKSPERESVHNRSYWSNEDWWGIGPGAHSHVGGARWWNVKHPSAYAKRLDEGVSPAHAREVLQPDDQALERVLLGLRLREGIPKDWIEPAKGPVIADFIARGLVDGREALAGRLVLTREGRLVADHLVRELT
ncbi:MAG: radical SAM family heme chaperone HemW [Pontimonas sp.]|nr:radical SAM family heme chaperone HemW [Pontimonas sp.]